MPAGKPFADYLHKKRQVILDAWQMRMGAEGSQASLLSKREFLDHVPRILDALEETLRTADFSNPAGRDESKGHGKDRWSQGFQLVEVVSDWTHLQKSLHDAVRSFVIENQQVDPKDIAELVYRIDRMISEGIEVSVREFDRLRSAESEAAFQSLSSGLNRLRSQAEESSGVLASSAHDVMGSISFLRQLARSLPIGDQKVQERLTLIEEGLLYNERLLEEMLILAKIGAGREHPVLSLFDASAAIRSICANARASAESKGLQLLEDGPEKLDVRSDPVKITRILSNLLSNAIRYTSEGHILVRWGLFMEGQWEIKVADTGSGIHGRPDHQLIDKLTSANTTVSQVLKENPVNTVKNLDRKSPEPSFSAAQIAADIIEGSITRRGNGLGLSIVKRLSDLLGGRLAMTGDSSGLVVAVVFPLDFDDAATADTE